MAKAENSFQEAGRPALVVTFHQTAGWNKSFTRKFPTQQRRRFPALDFTRPSFPFLGLFHFPHLQLGGGAAEDQSELSGLPATGEKDC